VQLDLFEDTKPEMEDYIQFRFLSNLWYGEKILCVAIARAILLFLM
jgi:hypothetical protein